MDDDIADMVFRMRTGWYFSPWQDTKTYNVGFVRASDLRPLGASQ